MRTTRLLPRMASWRPSRLVLILACLLTMLLLPFQGGADLLVLAAKPPPPSIAMLPDTVDAAVRIAPSPTQLLRLGQFLERLRRRPDVQANYDQLLTTPFIGDLTLAGDVLPWLGPDIALAVVRPAEPGRPSQAVMLLATRNTKASGRFVTRLRRALEQSGGGKMARRKHARVGYLTQPDGPALASINGFVVIASHEEAIQPVLALSKGQGAALLDSPLYQEVVAALPAERLGEVYLPDPNSSGVSVPSPSARGLRAVAAALRLTDDGLAIESAVAYDLEQVHAVVRDLLVHQADPERVLRTMPDTSLGALALGDARATWRAATVDQRGDPRFDRQLADFERDTGLGFEADIIDWLDREVGLALVNDGQPDRPGALLTLPVADRDQVQARLDRIIEALSGKEMTLESREIAGESFTVANLPNDRGMIGMGFVGEMLVVGSSEAVLAQAVQRHLGERPTLTDTPRYQAIRAELPADARDLAYVDAAGFRQMLEAANVAGARPRDTRDAANLLGAALAIGGAMTPATPNGVMRSALVVILDWETLAGTESGAAMGQAGAAVLQTSTATLLNAQPIGAIEPGAWLPAIEGLANPAGLVLGWAG